MKTMVRYPNIVFFPCCFSDKNAVLPPLVSSASALRDHAAFFQSEAMRPANDPKERDPSHVRMLNDVLRDLEKSFILPQTPAGVFRYTLDRGSSCQILFTAEQFSTNPESLLHFGKRIKY